MQQEQPGDIATRIKSLKAELEQKTDKSMTTGGFIATVQKYTRAKKLTPRMLNELVDRIEVHQSEKQTVSTVKNLPFIITA